MAAKKKTETTETPVVEATPSTEQAPATPTHAPVVEAKPAKEERTGIVYINTSKNNTMIHMTDLAGNTISRITGGMVTKHSRLKADPTIAMFVAKKLLNVQKILALLHSMFVCAHEPEVNEELVQALMLQSKALIKKDSRFSIL